MLKSIEEASKNFCIHQIREPHTLEDGLTKERTLIAYIDIKAEDMKSYRVYLAAEASFVQRVCMIFLEEDQSDEETLIDMTLETANLIIGSAKVIADNDEESAFSIGTPNFEKFDIFDFEYDDAKTLSVDNDKITIAIKELHG